MTAQFTNQKTVTPVQIELWPIDRLREYARNPRKNDAAVDRMCESIKEFGFKIPCLVRSDGEIVPGAYHHFCCPFSSTSWLTTAIVPGSMN